MIKERLISALIGTLLILAFQPFGLYAFGWMRWLLMLGIAVCVFAACVASEYIIRYVLRMPYKKEASMAYNVRRNVAFQIVNVIMMTAAVSVFLDRFACNDIVDNHLSVNNVMIVFASFVGASAIIGLYWKNVYWKRHYMHELVDAQRLNGMLEERNRTMAQTCAEPAAGEGEKDDKAAGAADNTTVLLEGSTKENVSLTLTDFLYAESDGNYVTVHYMKEGEVKKSVLRTSIKNVAQAVCGRFGITQCHRAFVVNVSYVQRVESRSSGIGLKLKNVVDVIPVSKSYVAEVKRLIQNPE